MTTDNSWKIVVRCIINHLCVGTEPSFWIHSSRFIEKACHMMREMLKRHWGGCLQHLSDRLRCGCPQKDDQSCVMKGEMKITVMIFISFWDYHTFLHHVTCHVCSCTHLFSYLCTITLFLTHSSCSYLCLTQYFDSDSFLTHLSNAQTIVLTINTV